MTATVQTRVSATTAALAGAVAGLGGGIAFGLLMGMMGILPLVGALVGQPNAFVGFLVHMAISAVLGAGFGGIVAAFLPQGGYGGAVGLGLLYGALWWVLGALILMPLFLGMTQMILRVGTDQWLSLMGHLIYGAVTGILFIPLRERL